MLMKKGFSPLIITFFISPDISTPAITLEDISRRKYRAIYLMTCNVTVRGAPLTKAKRSHQTLIKTKTSKPPTGGASL
jgi:hypothetical protein